MKKPVFLIFLLLSVSLSACVSKEINAAEKDLLITTDEVEAYGFSFSRVEELEEFSKDAYIDGSTEITYEFSSVETDEDVLYLSHTLSFESDASEARKTFDAYRLGMVVASMGLETEERNDIFEYGDGSSFRLVLNANGEYVGNVLLYHKGKVAGMLILVGIFFNEGPVFEEFISTKFQAAQAYAETL